MLQIYFRLFTILVCISGSAQIINLPDPNFKAALLNHTPVIDINSDNEISVTEAASVGTLSVSFSNINSLDGIENFVNLTYLNCVGNNLTEIDLSFLTTLSGLDANVNPMLTTINLQNIQNLTNGIVLNNLLNLTEVRMDDITQIGGVFRISGCSSLDTFRLDNLQSVGDDFEVNDLTNLAIFNLPALTNVQGKFEFRSNGTTSLQLPNLTSVTGDFAILYNEDLNAFVVPNLTSVEDFLFLLNAVTTIDLPALTTVNRDLAIANDSGVTSISIPQIALLERLYIYENPNLVSISMPGLIDIIPFISGGTVEIYDNTSLTTVDLSNLEYVEGSMTIEDVPNLATLNLENLVTVQDDMTIMTGAYNTAIFQSLNDVGGELLYNCTQPGSLQLPSLKSVGSLRADDSNLSVVDLPVLEAATDIRLFKNDLSSLTFPKLTSVTFLDIGNNQLTDVDFQESVVSIENYRPYSNQLSTIDLSNIFDLKTLIVLENNLTELVVDHPESLTELIFSDNSIATIDLNGYTALQEVDGSDNSLSELLFTDVPDLNFITFDNNQLTTIQFEGNSSGITAISLENNNLTELNLEQLTEPAIGLNAKNNQLVFLSVKNGIDNVSFLELDGNPDLQFICVDDIEAERTEILQVLNQLGYSECVVNSYCSFVPGGEYFALEGAVQFDGTGGNCATAEPLRNFPIEITDGTVIGYFSTDSNGTYNLAVQEGTHTFAPLLEESSYFNISPENKTVNFPADPSPSLQDFCITPNGVHPDLEIVIVEIEPARPGFEATYQLLVANKGTEILTPEISLVVTNFELMSYVDSAPLYSNLDGSTFTWDSLTIAPFQSESIEVTFLINTPTATPPVEIGDILSFTGEASFSGTDETPEDNIFELRQEVVGSFDPNDITCLEGATILPEEVGDYVHYLIRFENTGNFAAENVVIVDILNTDYFDIDTLRALGASHDFVVRQNENKVEFIFENIDLPFQPGLNEGYVVFKVKTNAALAEGDVFSNSAEIYFDFNAPIITNTYNTQVKTPLGLTTFNYNDQLQVIPNPVGNTLALWASKLIRIQSLYIYNVQGQEVASFESGGTTYKVDELAKGIYYVRAVIEGHSRYLKFIKD